MAEKQPRGYFELSDEEMASSEMVLTLFTMLESQGYHGFVELMSVLNSPELILKIVRLLYGTEIKIPPLKIFIKTLQAAIYTFCDMHKKININLVAKPKDIRQFMNITEEEEQELLKIFDNWSAYMGKNGVDLINLMHINRNNTKKRIKMNMQGKKWTKKIY